MSQKCADKDIFVHVCDYFILKMTASFIILAYILVVLTLSVRQVGTHLVSASGKMLSSKERSLFTL